MRSMLKLTYWDSNIELLALKITLRERCDVINVLLLASHMEGNRLTS